MNAKAHLGEIRVPLTEEAAWRGKHHVTAIYLNRIAAGVLIHVSKSNEQLKEQVSEGLRYLRQTLWQQDLARPIIAVFWAEGDTAEALRSLGWDQETHQGDFALREAPDEIAARALLWSLIGDTMGALDGSAREDKVGLEETLEALDKMQTNEPGERLKITLKDVLEAAKAHPGPPNLEAELTAWFDAEQGAW